MPTMTEPHQVAFYIKDILSIPLRKNQEPSTKGKPRESYYISFMPVNKQDVVIELRLTDHKRSEEYSDSFDKGMHPNTRAISIVNMDNANQPERYRMPPHKCNGCKIKRIGQSVPTKVYGTPEQAIQHLNTLICLFQKGYFGKYKASKNKSKEIKSEGYMNKPNKIRLTESQLYKIISQCVNEALHSLEAKNA